MPGMSGLDPLRGRLDELDDQIARALGERFAICREIALFKRAHDIPMMQPHRVDAVRARYLARGTEVELPSDFTAALFELLIGATCRMEDELMGGSPSAASAPAPSSVAYSLSPASTVPVPSSPAAGSSTVSRAREGR
jgi:chorismate mutase